MQKLDDHICDFSVNVMFKGTGLLGGKYEYKPYIGVHASFGAHKLENVIHLNIIGKEKRKFESLKQALPGGTETFNYDPEVLTYRSLETPRFILPNHGPDNRVDEMLWFDVWSHTRNSGVPELDKRESENVVRHTQCGLVALRVSEILSQYKQEGSMKGKVFQRHFAVVDQKIVGDRAREFSTELSRNGFKLDQKAWDHCIERATQETMKGIMILDITVNDLHEKNFQDSVFAMPNFQKRSVFATLPLSSRSKKGLSSGGGGAYNESSLLLKGEYEPISYTSDMGVEKMMTILEKHVVTPYCKHFIKMRDSSTEPLCRPLNKNVSNLQLIMWVSPNGQIPVANYFSCNDPTTREYANERMRAKDLEIYGFNEDSEKFFLRIARAAIRRQGISEQVFIYEIQHHFSLDNKSTKISDHFLLCEEAVAKLSLPLGYYTADYRFVRLGADSDKAKMIVIDSWDRTLLNNIGRSDDCEGDDETLTYIIRSFLVGRHTLGFQWASPLLNAIKLYLNHTVIYDVGATVTSAYMDNNNDQITTKLKDLPMIGDEMDRRSKSDGHCHALMGSMTDALMRIRNGNATKDIVDKIQAAQPQDKAFQARDSQRTMMVLEGTASMEPRILPVEESYQQSQLLINKKIAERSLLKGIRLKLDDRKKDSSLSDISDHFGFEGQAHYTKKQDLGRKVNPFYNEVVHASSLELWKGYDIALSQMAFAKKTAPGKFQYGAKIGDFLRNPSDYALVFPFLQCRPEWEKEVVPFMESVQHQQSIASFGRYSKKQYKRMERSSGSPQPEMEKLLASVSGDPNLSIVRLQSRPWKLNKDSGKTKDMKTFLETMPGVEKVGYFTEHHIPICHPIVEILCVVRVDTCLEMGKNFEQIK